MWSLKHDKPRFERPSAPYRYAEKHKGKWGVWLVLILAALLVLQLFTRGLS